MVQNLLKLFSSFSQIIFIQCEIFEKKITNKKYFIDTNNLFKNASWISVLKSRD